MGRIFVAFINIWLITRIFFKLPKEKMNLPSPSERLDNLVIAILVGIYFFAALILNLSPN